MEQITGIFEVEEVRGKPFINFEHFLEYDKRKDKEIEKLNKQIEKLEAENNLLKQLVGNNKQYTTGIR